MRWLRTYFQKKIIRHQKKEQRATSFLKAQSILFLVEAEQRQAMEALLKKYESKKIEVLYLSDLKRAQQDQDDLMIFKNDFSYSYTLKRDFHQALLNHRHDLLINLNASESLELQVLIAQSKSTFKTGLFTGEKQLDFELNQQGIEDFNQYFEALEAYLNKIS